MTRTPSSFAPAPAPVPDRGLGGHLADILRLAGPVVVSRAGFMVMAFADTVMVGRYSARELAFQSIGLAPTLMIMVTGFGLLNGTLVMSAFEMGAGRPQRCGAVWRRAVAYAGAIGILGAAISFFGGPLLLLLGQGGELAAGGGAVMGIIGLGLPALLIFAASSFFLEGLKRPLAPFVMMIFANLLNVALNWLLISGQLGFPALGAVGSAWATTASRTFLALSLVAFIWWMRGHGALGVREKAGGGWRDWARQRRIGYSAGLSAAVESGAFTAMIIFAGWLGVMSLGAYSIAFNLLGLVFMVALGLASATAVCVGTAHGRGNLRDVAGAGWTGFGINTVVMAAVGAVFIAIPGTLAAAYTTDTDLRQLTPPLIAFLAFVLVADGGQVVLANALRGRGETWVPVGFHMISYLIVMIPLAWALAHPAGRGAMGLFEGILIASILSVLLLGGRFHWLSRRDSQAMRLSRRDSQAMRLSRRDSQAMRLSRRDAER